MAVDDILVWSLAVVVGIACVFAIAAAVQGLRGRTGGNAFAQIAALIEAPLEGDDVQQWATGHFDGRRVRVRMMPGQRLVDSHGEISRYNAFEISVLEVAGALDWQIHRRGTADDRWSLDIQAAEPELRERLQASDALQRLEAIGNPPSVRYVARERTLYCREDVTPRLAPTPERFRGLIALAEALADINERINRNAEPAADGLSLPA